MLNCLIHSPINKTSRLLGYNCPDDVLLMPSIADDLTSKQNLAFANSSWVFIKAASKSATSKSSKCAQIWDETAEMDREISPKLLLHLVSATLTLDLQCHWSSNAPRKHSGKRLRQLEKKKIRLTSPSAIWWIFIKKEEWWKWWWSDAAWRIGWTRLSFIKRSYFRSITVCVCVDKKQDDVIKVHMWPERGPSILLGSNGTVTSTDISNTHTYTQIKKKKMLLSKSIYINKPTSSEFLLLWEKNNW